ncbi:condensation protein, partial [Streptomyces sp. DSM 41640]|nr:condensation protein [Streptomyces sp. DSM 41640]
VTGVRTAERGPDWLRLDGCWVSPAAVRDALGRAVGGLPVHVEVTGVTEEPERDGATEAEDTAATPPPGLTAYIACGDTPLTPAEAHRALTALIPTAGSGVLAPRRYVLVTDPPADPDRSDAWRRLKTIEEGTGRSRQV